MPRSDKKVSRLVGTALRQCLAETDTSVRAAASHMGVARSTVERWKRNGFVIAPLRSKRLALCFARNLHLLLEIRDGKAV
jgi:plasmid maintenance system antidote protein VapI